MEQAMPMGSAGQTKEYMEMKKKVRRKQGGRTGWVECKAAEGAGYQGQVHCNLNPFNSSCCSQGWVWSPKRGERVSDTQVGEATFPWTPLQPFGVGRRRKTSTLVLMKQASMTVHAHHDSQHPLQGGVQWRWHPSLELHKAYSVPSWKQGLWEALSDSIINPAGRVGFLWFQSSQWPGPPTPNLTAIWAAIWLDTATLFGQNAEMGICHIHHSDKTVFLQVRAENSPVEKTTQ